MEEYNLDALSRGSARDSLEYEEHRQADSLRESLDTLRGEARPDRPSVTLDDINREVERSLSTDVPGSRVSLAGVDTEGVKAGFDDGEYGGMDDTIMIGGMDDSGYQPQEGQPQQHRVHMPSLATAADLEQERERTQQSGDQQPSTKVPHARRRRTPK